MKRNQIYSGVAAALGMLLLIFDSKTALFGAREGLDLCVRAVIPSLFPFFVLSILLTGSLTGIRLSFLRPLGKLLRIPEGVESILLSGFLGGYPVGAQAVGNAFLSGQLKENEARRMLAFCNNAGPAFLFGIVSSLFPEGWMVWALWGIHILSAIFVSFIMPGDTHGFVTQKKEESTSLTSALNKALGVMARVCGWVVLFRVLIAFGDRWFGWMLPAEAQVILSGILELTNGCFALNQISVLGARFVLCSAFLAFGGVCVTFQTFSVTTGMDSSLYLPGKLLQTVFSILLSALVQSLFFGQEGIALSPAVPACLLVLPFFLGKIRNRGRNPAAAGV